MLEIQTGIEAYNELMDNQRQAMTSKDEERAFNADIDKMVNGAGNCLECKWRSHCNPHFLC